VSKCEFSDVLHLIPSGRIIDSGSLPPNAATYLRERASDISSGFLVLRGCAVSSKCKLVNMSACEALEPRSCVLLETVRQQVAREDDFGLLTRELARSLRISKMCLRTQRKRYETLGAYYMYLC
jgi:hypothetical protein